jgi:hypothetical protein
VVVINIVAAVGCRGVVMVIEAAPKFCFASSIAIHQKICQSWIGKTIRDSLLAGGILYRYAQQSIQKIGDISGYEHRLPATKRWQASYNWVLDVMVRVATLFC